MAVKIGGKFVGDGYPCVVVAEIGINHNGSVEIAKKLVDAAVEAGCDAVKFQKRTVEIVYTPEELAQPRKVDPSIIQNAFARIVVEGVHYQIFPEESLNRLKDNPENTTNGDLKHALEFSVKDYDAIDIYCREKGIIWYASSWDGQSVHFVEGFNVPCHKMASACLTHDDLLRRARQNGKPVILSTGMSTMEQIEHAALVLGREDLVLLHCVANYPCREEEVNLEVMETLRRKFRGVPVGWSGHEMDTLTAVAAAALGACMVERHITLDRNMPGSDHKVSLESRELKEMVSQIRRVEKMRGDGIKRLLESEVPFMKKLRRK